MALPPVLEGIAAGTRTRLVGAAAAHSVPAGAVLFEQGEQPKFQSIVLAGSVHLLGHDDGGREVLIETVHAPEFVVPAAALTASPYLMRGRAPEPTRLLLIQANVFRSAAGDDPRLAAIAIASLAGQFRRMVRQIKNLKLRSAPERVGCYILALAARQGTPQSVRLPFEKNLIASELGMTRESFSRALAALKGHGISVAGETILIESAERLATFSRPDPLIDASESFTPAAGKLLEDST